ncbi:hypothetical protein [Mucilaginibacter sp.]|uniref:hypothetical protein n=1 Tax=Mucilaginibacter sp. TaxID=1882438 RepID=UPI00374D9508
MIIIQEIKKDIPNSITIKFMINSRLRKKGSALLSDIASPLFTDTMSREVYIEPEWIEATVKQLDNQHKDKKVAYYLLRYQPGNIQLAAGYVDR